MEKENVLLVEQIGRVVRRDTPSALPGSGMVRKMCRGEK